MFRGTAKLPDGHVISICGTIQELSNWVANIILVFGGKMTVDIKEEVEQ